MSSVIISTSLVEELLVEEEDEQIDVDFGFIKHLHHGDLLVLQLQQILHKHGLLLSFPSNTLTASAAAEPHLIFEREPLHVHTHEPSLHQERAVLLAASDVKDHVLEPADRSRTNTVNEALL